MGYYVVLAGLVMFAACVCGWLHDGSADEPTLLDHPKPTGPAPFDPITDTTETAIAEFRALLENDAVAAMWVEDCGGAQ